MNDGAVYLRSVRSGGQERGSLYLDGKQQQWQHPWFVTPFWEDASWAVQINPGFVNGRPAVWPENKDGEMVQVPLTDDPIIPLPNGVYKQPARASNFFKAKGVKDPARISANISTGQLTIEEEEEGRMLLQTLIYLSVARASQKMEVDIPGNLVMGSLVEYKVVFDTTFANLFENRARIRIGAELPDTSPSIFDILSGVFMDDSFDHLPIATVYFVSPVGGVGTDPAQDWDPYVQHHLFWNVDHSPQNRPPFNLPGFGLDPFTAFFVGRYTLAAGGAIGAMNALISKALAVAFNEASNRGRFWTV